MPRARITLSEIKIVLNDRGPVTIDHEEWEEISSSYDDQEDCAMFVRENKKTGVRIVHGHTRSSLEEQYRQHGGLLCSSSNEDTVRTIWRVAGSFGVPARNTGQSCIENLPPEEL